MEESKQEWTRMGTWPISRKFSILFSIVFSLACLWNLVLLFFDKYCCFFTLQRKIRNKPIKAIKISVQKKCACLKKVAFFFLSKGDNLSIALAEEKIEMTFKAKSFFFWIWGFFLKFLTKKNANRSQNKCKPWTRSQPTNLYTEATIPKVHEH